MNDHTKEVARIAEENGYLLCLVDVRDILIEAMKDGRKTIDLHELDDRIQQMHEIRKVSGMTLTKEN